MAKAKKRKADKSARTGFDYKGDHVYKTYVPESNKKAMEELSKKYGFKLKPSKTNKK